VAKHNFVHPAPTHQSQNTLFFQFITKPLGDKWKKQGVW